MMKRSVLRLTICFAVLLLVFAAVSPMAAMAAETMGAAAAPLQSDALSAKAMAAAVAIGLAASGGAIAMGLAIAKSAEGISRQPEAEGKIRTTLMLGLVFIETVVIYALIVAILVIFVL